MKRQIAFTASTSLLPLAALGRQRRQARNPACSAASGRAKNWTFSRRGRRAAHDGRQYTPVVETAKTNCPSWHASRETTAFQRGSAVSIFAFAADISVRLSDSSMALVVMARKAYGNIKNPTIRILRSK